ncbi:MAG TPA: hypothetical protein VFD58_20495 [Blastocatellia bacterium]|nr:hypothetical protein [Blastocatellia bacterium]
MFGFNSTSGRLSRRLLLLAGGGTILIGAIGLWLVLKSAGTAGQPLRQTDRAALSAAEYARLPVPSRLASIPADLDNPNLEFSGLQEDGWMSGAPFFVLMQPEKADALTLRGMVPRTGGNSFATQLQVMIDERFVGGKDLGTGDFELTVPVPPGAGQRRVQLFFSRTQQLGSQDTRPASALLRFIGFEAGHDAGLKLPADITAPGISVGSGWYIPETDGNRTWRWVGNDAELTLSLPQKGLPALSLDVESGPGLDNKPFTLSLQNSAGQTLAQVEAREKGIVNLPLPPQPGQTETLRLHVDGGGRVVPGDNRVLNFRVFGLRLGRPLAEKDNALLQSGVDENGKVVG